MPSTMSGLIVSRLRVLLTSSMWLETQKIVEQVSYDPRYRVVVLTSALEKYFTAGLDRTYC